MQIDSGMDSGPVFLESEIAIPENEDAISLSQRLSRLGAEKLLLTLDLLSRGEITPVPQNDEEATYAPMLTKEEGEIDWSRDPRAIHNMVRGLVPWPCAYTYMGSKALKILQGTYSLLDHGLPYGIMLKERAGIKIACKGGFLIPEIVQLEGKKAMDSRAFSIGLHTSEVMLGRRKAD
jgi:methionyl-tRNA formyltransferase